MKRHFICILWCISVVASHAQTASENFILSRTFKQTGAAVNDVSKVNIEVQYLDGLGRPSQTVSVGQSTEGTDLIVPIEYDAYGRQPRNYLPYAGGGNGAFQANAVAASASWYLANTAGLQATPTPGDNLTRPYHETVFEASPANRPLSQMGPGTRSRSSNFAYAANDGSEVKFYKYTANADIFQTISSSGNYAAGTLFRKQTLDDQKYESIEFTDTKGRLICKKVIASSSETLATYYVYDDFGLLRAVLQPKYQEDANAGSFAFLYDYDEYARVITKYVPGGGKTELVYDIFDRQTMSQDANQLARGVWGFTKYDAFNRPVMAGEVPSAASRSNQQSAFNASVAHHEDKSGSGIGYTLASTLPAVAETHVLKAVYYDDYSFPSSQPYVNVLAVANNAAVKGQQTGSGVRMLNQGGLWLTSTIHYDAEYRPIQTTRQLYDLGATATERVSTKYKYDLAAVTDQEKTEHLLTGAVTNSVLKTFTYDHADRLLSVKEDVVVGNKTKSAITLAQRYNILGQLKSRYLHAYPTAPTQFRRRTDYVNNIRGWLTEAKTWYKQGATEMPFYGFALNYANVLYAAQYSSGNISSMLWSGPDEKTMTKGLSFTYDAASRLKSAAGLGGYADTESGINYDLNGNIKSLVRAGAAVDDLSYAYVGNRLSAVTDGSGSNLGMKNGTSNYSYDANGNVTSDGNIGASLTYNSLNLPKTVTMGAKAFTYDYDAAGTKHKYAGDTLTLKYAGSFEYNAANVFKRLATSEGQVVLSKADTLSFDYYVKDHLGNVRFVFSENGNIVQRTDYYPFGLEIARDVPAVGQGVRNYFNRYSFLGKETQIAFGYMDLSRRFYNPAIGRFMQVDPVIEGQDAFSPYHYSFNNPILYSDPGGKFPDCCREAIGGFVEGFSQAITRNVKALTVDLPETIQGMGSLMMPGGQIQAAVGGIILYQNKRSDWNTGDTRTRANILGNVVGEVAVAAASSKGASSLGKVGLVSDIAKVSEVANTTLKVSEVAAVGEASSKVLSGSETLRIQNAATRINKPINVVGSRASGTAKATSDWDYVIPGISSKQWGKIKNSLPGASSKIDNMPRNIDLFKGPVDHNRPHITINPR